MSERPRIVLIHATPVSVEPSHAAFAALWPEAETVDLLDSSLGPDRKAAGALTPEIAGRIDALGRYALSIGAEGILYTCSAFGPAIAAFAAAAPVPVLRPTEAMFAEALARGGRIGLVVSFGPSVASLEEEFREEAGRAGADGRLQSVLAEGAMEALASGDPDRHDVLLAEAASRLSDCDCVLLGQFSTARAAPLLRQRLACPVLTSPEAAVMRLREALAPASRENAVG